MPVPTGRDVPRLGLQGHWSVLPVLGKSHAQGLQTLLDTITVRRPWMDGPWQCSKCGVERIRPEKVLCHEL